MTSEKPLIIETAGAVKGSVVSVRMDKTITVLTVRQFKHPLYKNYIRRSTKIHAQDELNDCREGDTVLIEQCRPISKTKSWRLIEIIKRAD